jgi:hypothetical protein
MRNRRFWSTALLLTAVTLAARSVLAADFDVNVDTDEITKSKVELEFPMRGRDFINHVGIYVRFVPKQDETFPVFIDQQNYLTCPDKEGKKWPVNDVKQVDTHERSGVKVYAFFFDKPDCDAPVFHMKPIFGDS